MGVDKALLEFCGRPMVETAVATLREVCTDVTLVGDRDDLRAFAPVMHERTPGEGPAKAFVSALRESAFQWALVMPVDLPLMRAELLRAWTDAVVRRESLRASYLRAAGRAQPAVCLVRADAVAPLSATVQSGERRMQELLDALGDALWVMDAEEFAADAEECFRNVNTPEELAEAVLHAS